MSARIISQLPSSRRFARRVVVTGMLVVATCLIFVIMIPTLLLTLSQGPGIFFSSETFRDFSPDGQYEIRVYRRVNFPAFDVLSPSGTITTDIRKAGALGAFNAIEFQIHEIGELLKPEVQWATTQVVIDKIDYHNEYSFVLRFPEQ